MGTNQQFSLRWNNYLRHITCAFDSLRSDEDLVDVTLSCEGKRIRAHKMLLSACSTYFRDLFKENPCQHPVIIFRNVKFEDLSALIDFMYQGEVNVVQEQLASFLTTAELLAVQGLSDGNGKDQDSDSKELEPPDSPMLPPEPEVQMTNSHSQKSTASNASGRSSSPVSFFPVDQRSSSPPSTKRRKWGNSSSGGPSSKGGGTSSAMQGHGDKETEKEPERRRMSAQTSQNPPARQPSPDPVEIIPVVPNLKLEMPDYIEEQDASSCSYTDSNQGGTNRDVLQNMPQMLGTSSAEGKQEAMDIYSSNSRDASLPPSSENFSASDISQILVKPGPSGESQSQDSLQVKTSLAESFSFHVKTEVDEKILGTIFYDESSMGSNADHDWGTSAYVCSTNQPGPSNVHVTSDYGTFRGQEEGGSASDNSDGQTEQEGIVYEDNPKLFSAGERLKMGKMLVDDDGYFTYHCAYCRNSYPDVGMLKAHVHVQHDPTLLSTIVRGRKVNYAMQINNTAPKAYVCIFCDKAVRSKRYMIAHLAEHVGYKAATTIDGRLLCTLCGRMFLRRDSFSHHRKTHLEEIKCPVCCKPFTRPYDVRRHMVKKHSINS